MVYGTSSLKKNLMERFVQQSISKGQKDVLMINIFHVGNLIVTGSSMYGTG
jgi:hypothetical protein